MLNTNPKEVNVQGANLNVPQEEMLLNDGHLLKAKRFRIRGNPIMPNGIGCDSWHCMSTVVV